MGFTLAEPDAPADVYSIDVASRELTRWTYSEVGGLNPANRSSPQSAFASNRSTTGKSRLVFSPPTAPCATRKAPVLINIHGGPESQAQPFFSGTTQFYLNELGIAVICPTSAARPATARRICKLDNAEEREDSVKDIGALLDWIAQQPELDASRVAVTGGSYGGFMVLSSLTHFGNRIKAGIDIVGICNFNHVPRTNTSPYRRDLRRAEYGDERDEKMRAVFERISPASDADKIVSALLVAHGSERPARAVFSEARANRRQRFAPTAAPVWTVFADNEGHGFVKKDNGDYLTAVEAWFLKTELRNQLTIFTPLAGRKPAPGESPRNFQLHQPGPNLVPEMLR